MAASLDVGALVAKIMAKATSDTIKRLKVALEPSTEDSSELSSTDDDDRGGVSAADDDEDDNDDDSTNDKDELGVLKAWFMANLAHPYPSLSLRRQFAAELDLPVRNIDTQFTNWRRRTGWSHIMNTWAGGTKEGMKGLMSRHASGDESRSHVCQAIQRMAQYFEEDTPGHWVHNVLITADAASTSSSSRRTSSSSLASHLPLTPRSSYLVPSTESASPMVPSLVDPLAQQSEVQHSDIMHAAQASLGRPSPKGGTPRRRRSSTDESAGVKAVPVHPAVKRRRASAIDISVAAPSPAQVSRKRRRSTSDESITASHQSKHMKPTSLHPQESLPVASSHSDWPVQRPAVDTASASGHRSCHPLAAELQSWSQDGLAIAALPNYQPALLDWLELDTSSCAASYPSSVDP